MYKRSRKSKHSKLVAALNFGLFICSLTTLTVAILIVLLPGEHSHTMAPEERQSLTKQVRDDIDKEYAELLVKAKVALDATEGSLKEIRQEMLDGYPVMKDIEVTETHHAYWLYEPGLMLGVRSLAGGSLLVDFANRSTVIFVGERIDFSFEGMSCFLLLKSSIRGQASFRFGCNPSQSMPGEERLASADMHAG